VAESGFDSAASLETLGDYADAALIGTHFMRAPDIPAAIGALISPGAAVSR
jgi:indole-3-glycerol phosphate synthase